MIVMSDSIITWENGTPKSIIYDDIYFSLENGLLETNHVFINGNNLENRWALLNDDFTICETGFGTGLNFFAAWKLWQETGNKQHLYYTSIEKYPLDIKDIQAAISLWPEFAKQLDEFSLQYPKNLQGEASMEFEFGKLHLILKFSDIKDALPDIHKPVDAWFLDGFSPSKNPDMWCSNLYKNMERLTNNNGTFATFTAAGTVKRGLQEFGFKVVKSQGFGKKRHILLGIKDTRP